MKPLLTYFALTLLLGLTLPSPALSEPDVVGDPQSAVAEGEKEAIEEESDPLYTEKAYLRSLCSADPAHPECPKKKKRVRPPRDIGQICRLNQLHPKCQAAKNKLLEESYSTEKFCNSTKSKEKCASRRKTLKRMQKQLE